MLYTLGYNKPLAHGTIEMTNHQQLYASLCGSINVVEKQRGVPLVSVFGSNKSVWDTFISSVSEKEW